MFEDRIKRGVELLDKHNPGWQNKIDSIKLTMSSCRNCILGQLYGHYDAGVGILGIRGSVSPYGFCQSDVPLNTAAGLTSYLENNLRLTEEWKAYIGRC